MKEGLSFADTTNYDGAWDIFDVLSKIRMAFFRSLLESLGRKDGTLEDKSSPHTPFLLKPTAVNLIRSIIRELKFISKHESYMLIAVVPRNEQVAVINLVQREVTVVFVLRVLLIALLIRSRSELNSPDRFNNYKTNISAFAFARAVIHIAEIASSVSLQNIDTKIRKSVKR